MDISLALMTGVDIPLVSCQLVMHQPTLKEISLIGEHDFFLGLQTLVVNKTVLLNYGISKAQLDTVTNFNFLMQLFTEDKTKVNLVENVLTLLFPQYKINIIIPRMILFQNDGNIISLNEENFDDFQFILKQVFSLDKQNNEYLPADAQASEIAKKLLRARERVAAQKSDRNTCTLKDYISIVTVAVSSMSIRDVVELTIYQLYTILERYSLYINWDLDIKSRLAGGSSDEKIENWMKPLH